MNHFCYALHFLQIWKLAQRGYMDVQCQQLGGGVGPQNQVFLFSKFLSFFPTSHLCPNYTLTLAIQVSLKDSEYFPSRLLAPSQPLKHTLSEPSVSFSPLVSPATEHICPDQCLCTIILHPTSPAPLLNVSHALPFTRPWMPCKWWLHWLSLLPHPAIPVNGNSFPPGFFSQKESESISH